MNGTILAVAAIALATGPVAGDSVIERLAPENAILIASATDAASTIERFKQTAMWRLYQSDAMQKVLADDEGDSIKQQLADLYEELGVEDDSLVPPSGEIGIVIFAASDEEFAPPRPAFLAYAAYGDDADRTETLLKAALEKAERDTPLEWEEHEVDDWKVISIDLSGIQAAAAEDDEFGFDEAPGFMPGPEDMVGRFTKLHCTRRGDALIFSSNLESLRTGLHRLEQEAEGVAARDDYRTVRRQIGKADGFVVVLTRDLMRLASSFDEMGMLMMVQPMLRSAFGEISGYGFGVTIDGADSMAEATIAVTMPSGKSGLPALFDLAEARNELPPFVGPSAISYSRLHVKFDDVKDFVVDLVRSNPFLNMQLAQSMPHIESVLERLGTALGSEVHLVQTMRRPISLESMQSLVAVRCTRPQEFENLLKELEGAMPMEPRDFLGHRIYVMDLGGGMMPGMQMGGGEKMAVGIGGGYVFLGEPNGVEAALRTSGERDLPSLAEEAAYQRAVRVLPETPVMMWGYSSTIDVVEGREVIQRLQQEAMVERMVQEFPDFADEIRAEMGEQEPRIDVDFDLLRRFLGPSVWQVRSTEDGFLGRFYLLDAGTE